MGFLDRPTRHLFFTGKGGVGKTSTSCAVAVGLARHGRSVLLVSTDPASNLDEVLGAAIGTRPTPVAAVPGLCALNVDPEAAAVEYRERVVGPYRGVLPAAAVASIEEQLAGACTVEIAAFDEFAKLIGSPEASAGFDHIVFDTAPTGHTLRLLSLPAAWTGFIETSAAGTSCLGPLQGLVAQRDLYARAVAALSDPGSTTLVLVSRPDKVALDEAARTGAELGALGLANQVLVLNGVFRATDRRDRVAVALARIGEEALQRIPEPLARLERVVVPLKREQVIGIDALSRFFDEDAAFSQDEVPEVPPVALPDLTTLVDELESAGPGLIMTMGKGGVGKTTVAVEIAMALARRGHAVHLTTTDPAAHVVGAVVELPEGLSLGRIDPRTEVERYRDEVMATTGAKLDEAGRALLQEDLSSPCTEEIAVFQAFARTVAQAAERYVVIDTAPTGHTLLLLDAAQAYHREVSRQARTVSDAVIRLLPRLKDPLFTRILICTLPEATPVHEAAALQQDLRRAGIEPYAWVINQSLAPLRVTDPVLRARRAQERRYLDEVVERHAMRTILVPWREGMGINLDCAVPARAQREHCVRDDRHAAGA